MKTQVLSLFTAALVTAGQAVAVPVNCRLELDREALPADRSERVVLRLTIEAPRLVEARRPPVNLSIVLDRSGSMGGERIVQAREAAITALRMLTPRDRFSLVTFDSSVETLIPSQPAINTGWMEQKIREIQPRGMTAMFGGVSQGAAEVRKHLEAGYIHRLILLSDGKANVGPDSPGDLGRLAAALRKEGITVSTVGLGLGYNEDLMLQMAQASDGNSYFVEGSEALPGIFAAELGDVFDVMARDLQIILTLPDGVRPVRIIGRDGRVQANRVELDMAQIYGGQPRHVLVEIEIPPTPEGGLRPLAWAEVNLIQAANGEPLQVKAEATARFTRDSAEIERSLNVDVARDTVLNLRAESQRAAVAAADASRPQEAQKQLREAAARMRDVGGRIGDDRLKADAADLDFQAEEITRRGGLSGPARKEMMTESYQTIQQQRNR